MFKKIKKALATGIAATFLLMQGSLTISAHENINLPLESEFAIVVCVTTGHIIYGRDMHERAYPASMTKVMTALLLLESGRPMDEVIFHSPHAINSVVPWHSLVYDFVDYVTVEQALYALMLPSANDVSNAVAEFLAGSQEDFALLMTARAHELGALNTNFTNAHGLWGAEHFTTAYDMALIMREAIRHEKFVEVISTTHMIFASEDEDGGFNALPNTNSSIFFGTEHFNPDVVGGKTGFVNQSLFTLVSYGRRDGAEVITVIMRGPQRVVRYTDTRLLMDFAFDQFRQHTVFSTRDFSMSLELTQRSGEGGVLVIGEIDIRPSGDVILPLPMGFDASRLTTRTQVADRVVAPVEADFVVGRVFIELDDQTLATVDLLTARPGQALEAEELIVLFPEARNWPEVADYLSEENNLSFFSIISNIFFIGLAVFAAAFLFIRFLRFQSYKRRRARYRRQRAGRRSYGNNGTNFRYRYK